MFNLITKRQANLKNDVLAGLTAVLTLIPEAVAFTFVAGIDPMMGLYGSFFIGLITAIFGGRTIMISGAAGSMAVVTTAFIIMFGLEYLLAAVILTGILQVLFGIFKMGKFIRLLPHPVMLGFVNGLAIVIGLAQFNQFKDNTHVVFDAQNNFFTYAGDWLSLTSPEMLTMMGLIALTMAIVHFLPKVTKAVPAPLAAIVLCTLLVSFTPLQSKLVSQVVLNQRTSMIEKQIIDERFDAIKDTIPYGQYDAVATQIAADRLSQAQINARWNENQQRMLDSGEKEQADPLDGSLRGEIPSLHIPTLNWDLSDSSATSALITVFFLALVLASVGLIESLMTLSLIDEITQTKGRSNKEAIAQGSGNMLSGFFGGMCGCAMIGQSMICLNSGGRGRMSGISTALFMMVFILFFPSVIEMIPVASLIGVMFMVVIATFEWTSLRLFGKVPKSEIFIIICVSTVTVIFDLAIAVSIGVILSALVYAWNSAKHITVRVDEDEKGKTYHLVGNLFFGSITDFKAKFNPSQDPDCVAIDFSDARLFDQSAIEAVQGISEKYKKLGKTVYLRNLNNESAQLLRKANDIVEVNIQSTLVA
ncbi:MAG: TonB-dependent receptor [Alteromonadaceae bacterium]|jgi:SulP family sulfate permease|nr:TonB-dependent receptor [Alteromonadaceae bacterium]MBB21124.1 TonB-dependent receptor [Rickettsiales bacterium]